MAIKLAKLNLQTSVLPIWNPENKDYKIGYEKSWVRPSRVSKNSSENNFRILSANTVVALVVYGGYAPEGRNLLDILPLFTCR